MNQVRRLRKLTSHNWLFPLRRISYLLMVGQDFLFALQSLACETEYHFPSSIRLYNFSTASVNPTVRISPDVSLRIISNFFSSFDHLETSDFVVTYAIIIQLVREGDRSLMQQITGGFLLIVGVIESVGCTPNSGVWEYIARGMWGRETGAPIVL